MKIGVNTFFQLSFEFDEALAFLQKYSVQTVEPQLCDMVEGVTKFILQCDGFVGGFVH